MSFYETGDTASNLGSAVDELMRHQPTLKTDATTAIIKVKQLLQHFDTLPLEIPFYCNAICIFKLAFILRPGSLITVLTFNSC